MGSPRMTDAGLARSTGRDLRARLGVFKGRRCHRPHGRCRLHGRLCGSSRIRKVQSPPDRHDAAHLKCRIQAATIVPEIEVRKTATFAAWLDGLRDMRGRAVVQARIERLLAGNAGDVKPIGEGVSELRIDFGPGYRVYFVRQTNRTVILLAGGDKQSQSADIRLARRLAREA